jgi:hypothetical protein
MPVQHLFITPRTWCVYRVRVIEQSPFGKFAF